eukprot:6635198-Prymnesium_polylepis.1
MAIVRSYTAAVSSMGAGPRAYGRRGVVEEPQQRLVARARTERAPYVGAAREVAEGAARLDDALLVRLRDGTRARAHAFVGARAADGGN